MLRPRLRESSADACWILRQRERPNSLALFALFVPFCGYSFAILAFFFGYSSLMGFPIRRFRSFLEPRPR
jgi:hypothetical protein